RLGINDSCGNVPAAAESLSERVHFIGRQLVGACIPFAAKRSLLAGTLGATAGRLFLVQQGGNPVVQGFVAGFRPRGGLLRRLVGFLAFRRLCGFGLGDLRLRSCGRCGRAVGQADAFLRLLGGNGFGNRIGLLRLRLGLRRLLLGRLRRRLGLHLLPGLGLGCNLRSRNRLRLLLRLWHIFGFGLFLWLGRRRRSICRFHRPGFGFGGRWLVGIDTVVADLLRIGNDIGALRR